MIQKLKFVKTAYIVALLSVEDKYELNSILRYDIIRISKLLRSCI